VTEDTTTSPDTTVIPTTVPVSSIGDFVWLDTDLDGVQDVGEPGLEDVVVRLIGGDGSVVDEDTSDSQGQYELVPTSSGPFMLEVAVPEGFEPTLVDVGPDDAVDSDVNPADVVDRSGERTVRVAVDGVVTDDLDVGLHSVLEQPEVTTTSTLPTGESSTTSSTPPSSDAPTTAAPPTTEEATTTSAPMSTTTVPVGGEATVPTTSSTTPPTTMG
jgi:serine-aspartate repeat-containing protein C/D/E